MIETASVQYGAAARWGLMSGWLICPPDHDGPEISGADIARLVAAVEDLGTFSATDAMTA